MITKKITLVKKGTLKIRPYIETRLGCNIMEYRQAYLSKPNKGPLRGTQ